MTQTVTHPEQAWGLDFGGSEVRLVRVTRQGSAYRVEACHRLALDQRWSRGIAAIEGTQRTTGTPGTPSSTSPILPAAADSLFPATLTGLIDHTLGQPLAICLPDEAVLYRALELPPSDPAMRDRMVRAQLEVLLPSRAERFASAWTHADGAATTGPQAVLMAAVRRDTLEQATALTRSLGSAPVAAVPAALAAAAALRLGTDPAGGSVALIDTGARATSIALLRHGRVVCCSVLDEGADAWVRQIAARCSLPPADAQAAMIAALRAGRTGGPDTGADPAVGEALREALRDWLEHLAEVYHGLLQNMPRQQRPTRALLLGRSSQGPLLAALISESLRLPAAPAKLPAHIQGPEGLNVDDALPAIGAAILLLDATTALPGATPGIAAPNFIAARVERPVVTKNIRRRWAIAAGWLLSALLLLYGADLLEASWLGSYLTDISYHDRQTGGLDQALGVDHYLQQQGAPPLVILGAIATAMPRPMLMTGWTYSRNGDLRITASLQQPNQVDDYLKALGDCPLLRGVEIKSIHSSGGQQWECEVSATLAPAPLPAFMGERLEPKGSQPTQGPGATP